MRRAPERRRARLWKFFRWVLQGNLPRPAPRQRPGPAYGSVLLGDPPSFGEDDANPHCCVKPIRCSCRAVACGDRGVSCDMGRRPLVRRRWRCGSPFPAHQGMPPPVPRPPRSPRQSRLRSRTLLGPVVPRERSEGFTRLPRCRVLDVPANRLCGRLAHPSIRPCPPEMRRHGASVPTGCITPCESAILAHHRSRGTWASAIASYGCRARAGFPPAVRASPVWSEWLPTDHHTAVPRRRGIYTWHQGGTRKECLAALPPLAAMPI